jgi:hypothetical protein
MTHSRNILFKLATILTIASLLPAITIKIKKGIKRDTSSNDWMDGSDCSDSSIDNNGTTTTKHTHQGGNRNAWSGSKSDRIHHHPRKTQKNLSNSWSDSLNGNNTGDNSCSDSNNDNDQGHTPSTSIQFNCSSLLETLRNALTSQTTLIEKLKQSNAHFKAYIIHLKKNNKDRDDDNKTLRGKIQTCNDSSRLLHEKDQYIRELEHKLRHKDGEWKAKLDQQKKQCDDKTAHFDDKKAKHDWKSSITIGNPLK